MQDFSVKTKRLWLRRWPFLFLAVILLNYSNCKSTKMTYDEHPERNLSSTLDLSTICSLTEEDVFAQGYHQFFKTTCNNCHISGPGRGTFAHPTVATAFSAFQGMGYEKLSAMAVSDSHNYPYTGSHNIDRISGLKKQWRTFLVEKQKCDNTGAGSLPSSIFTPKFITAKKPIPAVTGTEKTVNINGTNTSVIQYNVVNVTYDLDNELSALGDTPLPATEGASLSISITGYSTPTGSTGYVVSMPELTAGNRSLKLTGLHVQINGQPIRYTYTFQHISQTLYQGTEALLSGGSMLILGAMSPSDEIALTIGDLQVIEMNAPPAPPSLNFDVATASLTSSDLGFTRPYRVAVSVTGDNTNPITVGLTTVGDESKVGIAKGILGDDGKNRFDWDYQIISPLSLTFFPGETTKYLDIIFSDDERDDVSKTLTLELADPFGASLGSRSTLVITIPDYNEPASQLPPSSPLPNDPAPTAPVPTFSELMRPGGILASNCVRCHNSLDRQGGYDMTDYRDMVARGIIVPGDPVANNHKMYRRMNPDAEFVGGITAMPLDTGLLPQDITDYVQRWIMYGAKNN